MGSPHLKHQAIMTYPVFSSLISLVCACRWRGLNSSLRFRNSAQRPATVGLSSRAWRASPWRPNSTCSAAHHS
ncbi:hypothetical protein E2C01_073893 [Portunus trituberculatus]|uniref:Uncharacterized protein n=1 Tax=Portunus trituberculatus TaxID=210409 RepID=A0A5B7IBV5_PORTR|nr:hypothetical protein [Portunus trituberculatus]